ncbi:ABC-2 transporter permease [Paenibacillus segetis]|uniref:ABC transporter permease n=1 Tax=Paenibacillus segetis TaxID=1325360 RepID=A0ABQ1YDF8_9BACL|nr:ABC-2 transporter permease [Paenibacillus segetis]GGH22099.1 ABC transporter permease [Paenibacillus segetis]
MLFNLVRKDFIIAKKYLLIMLAFAVIGPIFISSKLEVLNGSFISFLITVMYMEYILFNTVSMAEDKFKGSSLLSATPYTRTTLVKAKYLFVLVIFIISLMIYTITSQIAPLGLEKLNVTNVGVSLLTVSLFLGILIPVQFKFGYEKTKFIFFMVVFLTPFLVPLIMQWLQSHNMSMNITVTFPNFILEMLPSLIALVIGVISMRVSIQIYAKKNL